MLVVCLGDPAHGGVAQQAANVAELCRGHETIVVLEGDGSVESCLEIARSLRAHLPRFRFVFRLGAAFDEPDLVDINNLLQDGAVPLVMVPAGASRSIAELITTRFRAKRLIGWDGNPLVPEDKRVRVSAVPAGWCTRPPSTACVRTAEQGCHSCVYLEAEPDLAFVLSNVAARDAELRDGL